MALKSRQRSVKERKKEEREKSLVFLRRYIVRRLRKYQRG